MKLQSCDNSMEISKDKESVQARSHHRKNPRKDYYQENGETNKNNSKVQKILNVARKMRNKMEKDIYNMSRKTSEIASQGNKN